MQASMFNVRVPLEARGDVFLMNTLTDAQLIVSSDVAAMLDRAGHGDVARVAPSSDEEREALALLQDNGFLVEDGTDQHRVLDDFLDRAKRNTATLHVTLLTTLECNFACDYCFQGDHGEYNQHADRMSLATAAGVGDWLERELDRVRPERFVLLFFGGEPLLNLPVMYQLGERMWRATQARGVTMFVKIITNGLLLTPDVVDRMLPLGLNGIKITLDGDHDAHNRMRPLRGGQGTFDRILENVRRVAGRCQVAIGGNFDERSVNSFPALLEFLKEQEFAGKLSNVTFKPVFKVDAPKPKGFIPLTPVGASNRPLNGSLVTSADAGHAPACGSCDLELDSQAAFLREETKRHGFPTHDGLHNGPCNVHLEHAHTIGPDGSLYGCPGFTGQLAMSTGHIDGRKDPSRETAREQFLRLSPWKECGDCAFLPVCAGGCVAMSHSHLGDMQKPTCHKSALESALVSLAHTAASAVA